MSSLFGDQVKTSKKNIRVLEIKLSEEDKNLIKTLINNTIKTYSLRIDYMLSDKETEEIIKNIFDTFNYSLTIMSTSSSVSILEDDKINFIIEKEDDDSIDIKGSNRTFNKGSDIQETKTIIVKNLILKDVVTSAKYNTVGYIQTKKRKLEY